MDQFHFLSRTAGRRCVRGAAGLAVALALGGCSVDLAQFRPDLDKLKETVAPRDLNVFQRRAPMTGTAVTAEDLVGPDGRCAFDPAPTPSAVLNFTAGPATERGPVGAPAPAQPEAPGAPALTRGVALGMTECEVVRVAGYTSQVEIGANERGQRSTVLTYAGGPRPGVYRFTGGRLVSVERGPEPPPAAKPAKPARKQKTAG